MSFLVDEIINVLERGKLTLKGEFIWGSNYTFLAEVALGEERLPAVYKPTRGERPLWDFPPASLAKREVAAFLVSQALGWELVPPTVYRIKGPFGAGSLQLYVEHDPEYHYFTFKPADLQRLRPVVLFDLLINNADRKGSHILIGNDGHLWLIDHGVSFHVEEKLRTVIWDYAGEQIPEGLRKDVGAFCDMLSSRDDMTSALAASLAAYLNQSEIGALLKRARKLASAHRFPYPDPRRRMVPWPEL